MPRSTTYLCNALSTKHTDHSPVAVRRDELEVRHPCAMLRGVARRRAASNVVDEPAIRARHSQRRRRRRLHAPSRLRTCERDTAIRLGAELGLDHSIAPAGLPGVVVSTIGLPCGSSARLELTRTSLALLFGDVAASARLGDPA